MALKGEKQATVTCTYNNQHYGPWFMDTFKGGEQTMAAAKKRKAASRIRKARSGLDDVGNVTVSAEDDGSIDLKFLWAIRRGDWTIVFTPADEDGNPRAKDSATYTGKLIRLERGEGDNESEDDVDVFELEFNCDSVVS